MMQLQMVWPEDQSESPEPAVADGYTVFPMRTSDEAGQVEVMLEAGFENWDGRQLTEWQQRHALPEGIFVAEHTASGRIVATAMACHKPTQLHPIGGELGWVAARPDHSGKGLGTAICAAVLRRFLQAGYRRIYLKTDDFRLAALRTYLRLGFRPFHFASDMEPRWRTISETLKLPYDPGAAICAPEDLWIHESVELRPDSDRTDRYAPRHTWLPDRVHRGFSCDGDVDAFGDESLYMPSRLGSARCNPQAAAAGARSPLSLMFTAGAEGVPEGATVTFAMRGQSPLGRLPELSLACSGTCDIAIHGHGFAVTTGEMAEGDKATVSWPSFEWTPLAGRREFKVIITYGDGRPEQRLPEPVVVHVLPGEIHGLAVSAPCTHRNRKDIGIHISARDGSDNRAPYSGAVRLTAPSGEKTVHLVDGRGTCDIAPVEGSATRVSVESDTGALMGVSNPSVPSDGRQLFVGDLHCHDFMSEAEGYTDDVYRWAIEDQRLDFVSVVPQSHGWQDNETWTVAKYMNERFLREGEFVTFLGFEWQHTGYGDKVIHYLGGDQPYLPRDDSRYGSADKLYEALRGSDALVIGHHPAYPVGSWCSSTDFDSVETDVERLVELWSMHGSSEGYDPADRPLIRSDPERLVMPALRRGVRLGFIAGSDTHSGRPGGSAKEPRPYWGGLTAVWADDLTRRDLFGALLARRTYALTRARIVLEFTVNGMPMGSEAPQCTTADIRIDVWAPGRIAKIEVLKNTELLREFSLNQDECHTEMSDRTGGPAFYHCRVTLADGNLAVCSPVWLG
jgi:mycothiol synthase